MPGGGGGETVQVSAPGKVILHGEHSVVYGKLALAVSINLRTRVKIRSSNNNTQFVANFPDLRVSYNFELKELKELLPEKREKDADKLDLNLVNRIRDFLAEKGAAAVEDAAGATALLYLYLTSELDLQQGLEVTVSSEVPIGAGLGSSAAFSVALSAAMFKLAEAQLSEKDLKNGVNVYAASRDKNAGVGGDASSINDVKKQKMENNNNNNKLASAAAAVTATCEREETCYSKSFGKKDQEVICKRAFLAEKILHGNPSGIDNSVCTYGGLLTYQSSTGMKPLKSPTNLRILLINTRVSRNTRCLVERVRARALLLPKVAARILDAMDQVSYNCLETLNEMRRLQQQQQQQGDNIKEAELFRTLEELIDTNQGLLSSLGVSHPSLDLVQALCAHRGMHAKLTGAGGGGFAFALVTPVAADSVKELRKDLEDAGFDCWETEIGGAGVQFA